VTSSGSNAVTYNAATTMSTSASRVQVAIVVYSRFGVLRQLAEALAEGVTSVGSAQAHIIEVTDEPLDRLAPGETEAQREQRRVVLLERLSAADAVVIGAPAYFGSMASAVKRFFEDVLTAGHAPPVDRSRPWHYGVLHDKVGAAFTASATPHGGNELALHSILTLLMHVGALIVTPGQAEPILDNPAAPYGATAITGASGDQPSSPEDLLNARSLGARVAAVATWVKLGRSAFTEEDGKPSR
jgi:NAD(P)H dehydrogenase (quinone)